MNMYVIRSTFHIYCKINVCNQMHVYTILFKYIKSQPIKPNTTETYYKASLRHNTLGNSPNHNAIKNPYWL